jgi:hypothetical protein
VGLPVHVPAATKNCWRRRFLCGPCRIKGKQAINYFKNFLLSMFKELQRTLVVILFTNYGVHSFKYFSIVYLQSSLSRLLLGRSRRMRCEQHTDGIRQTKSQHQGA